MFERAAKSWRPKGSVDRSEPPYVRGSGPLQDDMTRAQARARARCEPLTPDEFKARRRVADQGVVSLFGVLHTGADAHSRR